MATINKIEYNVFQRPSYCLTWCFQIQKFLYKSAVLLRVAACDYSAIVSIAHTYIWDNLDIQCRYLATWNANHLAVFFGYKPAVDCISHLYIWSMPVGFLWVGLRVCYSLPSASPLWEPSRDLLTFANSSWVRDFLHIHAIYDWHIYYVTFRRKIQECS